MRNKYQSGLIVSVCNYRITMAAGQQKISLRSYSLETDGESEFSSHGCQS